jgi:Concanavalin A-like lectin/glucanases superfamily
VANPTLKVEISFVSTPLATSPTWVDVSAYVRRTPGLSISRGKGERAESFDAGHLQLTLSNRDRRFDPSYSAGPYFGNLIPRKQIKVTATWAAVDYIMFKGWVTGWPQGFEAPGGKDATVTIEAVDPIAWLANNNLPDDLVYTYANSTIGSLAFFLRGADTSTWSDATSNGYFATKSFGVGRTSASLMPGMSSTAVQFDGATRWTPKNYTSSGAWSLAFWVQTNGTSLTDHIFNDSLLTTYVAINNGTQIALSQTSSLLFTIGNAGETFVADGKPHHIAITSDNASAAGIAMYYDGVAQTVNTNFSVGTAPLIIDEIGDGSGGATFGTGFTGALQDFAVFNKQLSASEVQGLYDRSRGFLQESSADRVTRLLDDVGWPATWREITTNPRASVGELVYNGSPALDKLQEAERSEQGRLFATKAGYLAFRERFYASEVTVGNTVQQIFSDDGGATALPYSSFQFQFNDVDVTNAASVTTPDTRAASSDSTSITANGLQSKQVDTNLADFTQADSMAEGLVAAGKDPTYRVAPIVVYPANNTTRWDEVFGLELGYRVSMEITPMKVGSQNVQEVTLERMDWLIEADLWTLIVGGSPCKATTAGGANGWFVIGTSLIGSTTDLIGY